MSEHERIALRITGRVQGVGFRWWTTRLARELGVAGTVRNRPDGSVEVRAEAEREVLARFRASLERGPTGAAVNGVETLAEEGGALPDPFEVAH